MSSTVHIFYLSIPQVNQDQQYNTAVQQEDLKCKIVFTFILAGFSAKVPFRAQN